MPSPPPASTPPLAFHGGTFGALAPFALFLGGVAWLALAGAPDEHGFWPILVAALIAGLLLARDRTAYCDRLIAGMSQPIVLLMIMAWLLAGVIGTVMSASGFVDALVWLARLAGLGGGGYVAAAFLACCLVSTSTGTSFGTILVCAPLLYPAGGAVLASPAMLAGAILAGATFGDSISPISDTTIASSGTQGADIGGTVRSRLKYVLPAALVALIVFAVFGGGSSASAPPAPDAAGARGLPMLVVPALVIWLLLRGRHLVEGLLLGVLAAVVTSVGLGLVPWSRVMAIDAANFTATGLVIDGITRGLGVSVFTILLTGLVATVKAAGVVDRLAGADRGAAASPRTAELRIFGAVSAAVLLTTHSVVAILTVGELASRVGGAAGLTAYRRANVLDVTVCTYPFLLPYFIPPILAGGATRAGEAFGMPRVTPFDAGLHNAYSWALLAIVVAAIVTGYGREEGAPSAGR
ncbi:MAG: Na+/H+ antiporter NhaC family protein [Vicinamibacterales bacterium]